MNPEVRATAENLRNQLKAFTEAGPTLQQLEKRLGDSFFAPAEPPAKRIIQIFHLLRACELEQIPVVRLKKITSRVNDAVRDLVAIKDYSTGSTQDFAVRMSGVWEALYDEAMPNILYANMLSGRIESEAAEITERIKLTQQEVAAAAAEVAKTLDGVKRASAEVGVSQQAIYFKEVADSHRRMSRAWGGLTAVLVIVGFWFAFSYLPGQLDKTPTDLPSSRIAQLIFNKVLAVSLLSFGIGWAARNFSASRHNFVANQHRQTALSTFEAIVNGVKDDVQARNAVLVYASQAIFTPAATGYSKGDIEIQQISPVVDLVASVRKIADTKSL